MSYLVLARKWRPSRFEDLVGQEPIMRILTNAISHGKIAHAYLFSGPRGVGKTSSARILAKALNCKEGPTSIPCGVCESCTAIADGSSIDVMEIDGASNNSVDDIRDLRERVKYAPSGGRYKVYIIDEVHMLSGSAFNALLKTLEEPPSHVIFVLATTEMRKIPATVLSRCQHMPFRRLSSSVIRARLKYISESEGIHISSPALSLVARAADGSMRDSLTILDQLSSFSMEISEEEVKSLLGIADFGMLAGISKALITGNRVEIIGNVNLLVDQGTDIRSFTKELVQFFRDLLVASVVLRPEDVLDLSPEETVVVKDMIASSSEDQLTLMLSEIMKAETDVRNSASPRLALEMALIRASFLSTMKPLKEVIENITKHGKQQPREWPDNGTVVAKDKGPVSVGGSNEREIREHEKIPDSLDSERRPTDGLTFNDATEKQTPSGDLVDLWGKTLARIEPPLSSQLLHTQVELKGETELFLTLDGAHAALFGDSIRQNLAVIEKIASEEAGKKVTITLTALHKKVASKKSIKGKIMDEPLIKEALELFDGRIVELAPLDNPENKRNGGDHV